MTVKCCVSRSCEAHVEAAVGRGGGSEESDDRV